MHEEKFDKPEKEVPADDLSTENDESAEKTKEMEMITGSCKVQ